MGSTNIALAGPLARVESDTGLTFRTPARYQDVRIVLDVTGVPTVEQEELLVLASVHTFDITATPDGSIQNTDFELPADAILLFVALDVTTAEVTGTTKKLDVVFQDNTDFTYIFWVDALGKASVKAGSGAFTGGGHESEKHVRYIAESNNWNEFRGTLKIVYIAFDDLV